MNRRHCFTVLAAPLIAAEEGPPPARPTPEQIEWQDMELEMFLCLDPCTWQNREYDDHSTPLDRINPAKLDTDQWVDVAASMEARQIVFVAKHTGGFCWWRTETSRYGVKEIPWRSGKGDVAAMLAASCRRRGLKLGIYLSPQDDVHGAGVGGRCKTPEQQAAYDKVYRQQLTELVSRYGPVSEVWFDGSIRVEVGDILRRHCPHAMVFQSKYATLRWVGNEQGIAPYPAWNAVPRRAAESGVATAKDGDPQGEVWLPLECDARIRSTWFWNQGNADTLKSVEELMRMYYRSVGHGAVLLLNNTPDTSGLIPAADARRSAEFGAEIRRRFGNPLAEATGEDGELELALPRPAAIDHVIVMEDIRGGERVREYRVEALSGGRWVEVSRGTAVGHKKIDAFAPVTASRIRFTCSRSSGRPLIRRLAAYAVGGTSGRGAPLSTSHAYHVVKQWGPEDLVPPAPPWEIDITPYCQTAGQYEVDFIPTGGRTGLRVEWVSLRHGETEAGLFVTPAPKPGRYRVNITGLGVRLTLLVKAAGHKGSESYGQVTIRLAPPEEAP